MDILLGASLVGLLARIIALSGVLSFFMLKNDKDATLIDFVLLTVVMSILIIIIVGVIILVL